MSFKLHYHPLSSFCHKTLFALYEKEAPFEKEVVDLSQPEERERFEAIWPIAQFPVLTGGGLTEPLPEASLINEYVDAHYAGSRPLMPTDAASRFEVRFWDRFFDLYVHLPSQKIISDRLREKGREDPAGVHEARDTLQTAYGVLERRLSGREWIVGKEFTLADCSAAPPLFYGGIVEPFTKFPSVEAYLERLLARPAYRRILREAQPFFHFFPYYDQMPTRFKNWE